ncbi:acyloxyacyl hydrolase [Thalassotalea euphylliae]|uniref:Acyloxyacyl hydrolase n=1 Tax=Thalassotalea euphylliae TaxID=1655234 RepID=A0A3E0UDN0_9GAMM|nr:acyloxyacyl hydrolase [Thalassotalea euphylliae]REL34673.1 hypothetical protein DXX92_04485 [Thalassotalea euphylliae]
MKNSKRLTLPSIFLAASIISPVMSPLSFADTLTGQTVSIGVSNWGIFDSTTTEAFFVQYDYHTLPTIYNVKPTFMFMSDVDGNQYYAVGANRYWQVMPNVTAGFGFSAGYLKHTEALGDNIEFYSRFIARYHFNEDQAVKFEFGHISNAGFGDINPGSENVALSYEWSF